MPPDEGTNYLETGTVPRTCWTSLFSLSTRQLYIYIYMSVCVYVCVYIHICHLIVIGSRLPFRHIYDLCTKSIYQSWLRNFSLFLTRQVPSCWRRMRRNLGTSSSLNAPSSDHSFDVVALSSLRPSTTLAPYPFPQHWFPECESFKKKYSVAALLGRLAYLRRAASVGDVLIELQAWH